ncbi:unnamed protein product [Adineta ricciae]|uniref:Uncharacterized protein n=1 Tax=Adineta ricciae TaxID=249248 RepID=A0A815I811_ADIRI|nr:unnamed protein product [Adineta ricciae]CAF1472086.1 unnamed protein product [Adineta ricciae]
MNKATEELLDIATKETKNLLAEIQYDIKVTKAMTDDDDRSSIGNNGSTKNCPNSRTLVIGVGKSDAKLGKKYARFLTGAVLSSCLCGTVILAAEVVFVVAGGALLAIAVAVGCITDVCQWQRLRTVYSQCSDSVRLMLVSCFPSCFDGATKDPTEAELASIIEKAVNTLNIKEDTWFNHPALQMLKGSGEVERDHLKNS